MVVVHLEIWRLPRQKRFAYEGGPTTMDRYIGIDVHSQSCTVSVKGASGKRLALQVVQTTAQALVDAVTAVKGRRYVCIEEGTQSEWLHELLEPFVEDIAVIVPPPSRGNKSDAGDADGLADIALQGKADKRVFKGPPALAGLRDASRAYQALSKDLARIKNRIKAVFRSRAVVVDSDVYRSDRREPWLAQLPTHRRRLVELLAEELDALAPLRQKAEQWLLEEARQHPAVRRLKTAPGLADVRAATVVAIVGSPQRFRTSRQFWSYCGLSIVTRSSADWERRDGRWIRAQVPKTRGLTRVRQPLLKSVFKGAATTVTTRMTDHPLHHDYQRMLAAGVKPNLAKLTIARRLAAICLAMWKKQEDYDPQKHRARTTAAA
jgi:transposase